MRIANAVDAARLDLLPSDLLRRQSCQFAQKRTASFSPFAVHVAGQKAVAGAVRFSCEL